MATVGSATDNFGKGGRPNTEVAHDTLFARRQYIISCRNLPLIFAQDYTIVRSFYKYTLTYLDAEESYSTEKLLQTNRPNSQLPILRLRNAASFANGDKFFI